MRMRARMRTMLAVKPTRARTPRLWQSLARGLKNREISAAPYVSEATVKTHVARVLDKLGLRDRGQAIVAAYETGLVHPRG